MVAVQRDALNQPLTDSSTDFINAPAAYSALHSRRNAGQGVLLGNLDTGVWPEHPSFADQGNLPGLRRPGAALRVRRQPADGGATTRSSATTSWSAARAFLDTYELVAGDETYADSARDPEGHGSHTASTSAGNVVTNVADPRPDAGPHQRRGAGCAGHGVPRLRPRTGCYSSDSAAAVAAGHPRRRRRHQLLHQRWHRRRRPTRSSWRSSTPTTPVSSSPPRPATTAPARRPPTTSAPG